MEVSFTHVAGTNEIKRSAMLCDRLASNIALWNVDRSEARKSGEGLDKRSTQGLINSNWGLGERFAEYWDGMVVGRSRVMSKVRRPPVSGCV